MAEDIKKSEIEDAALETVAGGWGSDADAVCPKCKSTKVHLYYEHDERAVMKCDACGNQFVIGEDQNLAFMAFDELGGELSATAPVLFL